MTSSNINLPFASVVICTYNRKNDLRRCLDSIKNQIYPKDRYEIIVVDGGSTDGTDKMVEMVFPEVKLIIERRRGVAYARNKGAEESRGFAVVYTDDDCIPDRNWLESLVASLATCKVGGVGGPVLPVDDRLIPRKFYLRDPKRRLFPFLFDLGNNLRYTDTLLTANAAFKKEVFTHIKFDTKLGRRGLELYGMEEIDFCRALSEIGYKLLYVPQARVYHKVDPNRMNLRYIIKRGMYEGISYFLYLKKRKKTRTKITFYLAPLCLGRIFGFYFSKGDPERVYYLYRFIVEIIALTLAVIVPLKVLNKYIGS